MSHNGQHAPSSPDARSRRNRTIALVVVIGTVALAVGLLLGSRSGGETETIASSSPTAQTPSPSQEPGSSDAPSPSATSAPSVASEFEDGRHFVLADAVESSEAGETLVADLGYFLTGDEANEAAADAGFETPVPNDYFIVNENPKLRRVPLAADAQVRYIPADPCCDLQSYDLQAWIDAVNGEVQTDMIGEMSSTWWWITVEGGQVVAVEQQYLP